MRYVPTPSHSTRRALLPFSSLWMKWLRRGQAHLGQSQLLVQPHTDVAHEVEICSKQGQKQQQLKEKLAHENLSPNSLHLPSNSDGFVGHPGKHPGVRQTQALAPSICPGPGQPCNMLSLPPPPPLSGLSSKVVPTYHNRAGEPVQQERSIYLPEEAE